MTKEEIQQATFEKLSNRFSYLYNQNQHLLYFVNAYYFDKIKLFSYKDIKEFKNTIKKNNEEMELISKYRPECAIVITIMGG